MLRLPSFLNSAGVRSRESGINGEKIVSFWFGGWKLSPFSELKLSPRLTFLTARASVVNDGSCSLARRTSDLNFFTAIFALLIHRTILLSVL